MIIKLFTRDDKKIEFSLDGNKGYCSNQLCASLIEKNVTDEVNEFKVNVRLAYNEEIFIQKVQILIKKEKAYLFSRGGLGQPVFSLNEFYSMRHPYAKTFVHENFIVLEQYPGFRLCKDNEFTTFAVVQGKTSAIHSDINVVFSDYVRATSIFDPRRVKIYCDWALHDELGEEGHSVQLTEKLTRDNIDFLMEINEKYNIQFDYYLIDHGWYSEKSFMKLKKPNFEIDSLEEISDKLVQMNTKLGLWFSVNTFMIVDNICCGLNLEDLKVKPNAYCLKSAFGKHLFDSMRYAINEWGVRLLKLDFADFDCCAQHNMEGESEFDALIKREQEVNHFLYELKKLKKEHPDVLIVAFNGFNASCWWLDAIDTLYIGDVRPSDTEAMNLRMSINLYTARQLKHYNEEVFVPKDFLDDCGTFIGQTTTNFYMGAHDFKSQAILCFTRGVALQYIYGDMSLLYQEELNFYQKLLEFDSKNLEYLDAYRVGEPTGKELFFYVRNKYVAACNPTPKKMLDVKLEGFGGLPEIPPYGTYLYDTENKKILVTNDVMNFWCDGDEIAVEVIKDGKDYNISVDKNLVINSSHIMVVLRFYENGEVFKVVNAKEVVEFYGKPHTTVPERFCWSGVNWLVAIFNNDDDLDLSFSSEIAEINVQVWINK